MDSVDADRSIGVVDIWAAVGFTGVLSAALGSSLADNDGIAACFDVVGDESGGADKGGGDDSMGDDSAGVDRDRPDDDNTGVDNGGDESIGEDNWGGRAGLTLSDGTTGF